MKRVLTPALLWILKRLITPLFALLFFFPNHTHLLFLKGVIKHVFALLRVLKDIETLLF